MMDDTMTERFIVSAESSRSCLVDVEVCLSAAGVQTKKKVYHRVVHLLQQKGIILYENGMAPSSASPMPPVASLPTTFITDGSGCLMVDFSEDGFLSSNVEYIAICSSFEITRPLSLSGLDPRGVRFHLFHLQDGGNEAEDVDNHGAHEDATSRYQQWILPCRDFDRMWESLVFDDGIKGRLLSYIETGLLFADKAVNTQLISWNRIVLLYGYERETIALAQKIAIRLQHRYDYGLLIELNAHSLFSKWFSESGKMVLQLFEKIRDVTEANNEAFVCLLIDEVESLTAARSRAIAGNEPSDAVRVVNALLTQIDRIKHLRNIVVLTTSNVSNALDDAFLDRADVKQYIGLPGVRCRYNLLKSAAEELMRVSIISPRQVLLDYHSVLLFKQEEENKLTKSSLHLLRIASLCEGVSGRSLRKLPFVALALYVQQSTATLAQFLDAVERAIIAENNNNINDDPSARMIMDGSADKEE
ncbi:Pachytene checkpoint protein 2 [Balamuthia mandrillaris]